MRAIGRSSMLLVEKTCTWAVRNCSKALLAVPQACSRAFIWRAWASSTESTAVQQMQPCAAHRCWPHLYSLTCSQSLPRSSLRARGLQGHEEEKEEEVSWDHGYPHTCNTATTTAAATASAGIVPVLGHRLTVVLCDLTKPHSLSHQNMVTS